MASREPNNLRLPATSSSKLSGASTLTIEVSICAHSAKDSRLCRSRGGDLSNTCKEAASAMAVLELRSRSDAGLGCRTARGDDVQLPSLGLDDHGGQSRIGGGETFEREARQAHGDPKLRLAWDRPTVAARSLDGARSEQVERLQNARHDRSLARSLPGSRGIERKAGYIDDARPPASAFDDLHARRRVRRCDCTCERTDSQRGRRALRVAHSPAETATAQHPWSSAASCKRRKMTSSAAATQANTPALDPERTACSIAHSRLLIARRGMNHQQAIDVDAVLLQSRGIRHERRSYPSDPLLGLGRIFFRQCRQCRHQQPSSPIP